MNALENLSSIAEARRQVGPFEDTARSEGLVIVACVCREMVETERERPLKVRPGKGGNPYPSMMRAIVSRTTSQLSMDPPDGRDVL